MGSPATRPKGSFWPSRTQESLLTTALAEPDRALNAWSDLVSDLDLHTLESGTISALPLVYRNVSRALPDDPHLPHLKGILRSTWVRNNLLVERLAEALESLQSVGVETVLLGSLAAAVRYYPEFGLRPTPALDFLLPARSLTAGGSALGRLGWSAQPSTLPPNGQPLVLNNPRGETCLIRTAAAIELDLNYDDIATASVETAVGRCTVRAPSPEHDLLIACASGARTKTVRSVQWLVDVAQISRAVPIDWEMLLTLARQRGQSLRLHETFAYLSEVLGVALPEGASCLRDASAVPIRERIAYRCAGAPSTRAGWFPHALSEHLVATRARSGVVAALLVFDFLRRRWGLTHRRQVPIAGARRALDTLVRRGDRET